ncbi:arsinothricin resistance N-acetyltransferase ArsN1 family B [Rubrivirga sp. IMCC43871]|uniref:arsinothricin resistance N-acetyltransferase ArsN1 family B n=1 Tax=Rubrivirga sp. IMCC43871 TaxID=3391575 RepID=UPI00398FC625
MTIRLATEADAPGVRAIYAPFVRETWVSFETAVPSVEEMARRIAAGGGRHPWLVADDGAIAGYAYAGPHRSREAYQWSAEVSVYVAERARRRGVARALYGTLLDVLGMLGMATAYAGVALPNAASVAFHTSIGFEPVGVYRGVGFKAGAWRDVGWWALRLGDGSAPAPPRPLSALGEALAGRLAAASDEIR